MNFSELERVYRGAVNGIADKFFEEAYAKRLQFERVYSMLSDEESKALYASEIARCLLKQFLNEDKASVWTGLMSNAEFGKHVSTAQSPRVFGQLKNFSFPSKDLPLVYYFLATTFVLNQYKYKDVVKISEGDVCIDCGACLGDTAIWMLNQGAKKVYSFEIDKLNLECLSKTIENGKYKIKPIGKAVSDKDNEVLYYTPNAGNVGGGTVSSVQSPKSCAVESCTLDKFCSTERIRPDFIKMDIEGAEMSALQGASKIIQECKPKLAVCIYHSWEDRFRIPIWLNETVPEYKMYLKKSHPSAETVLFCTV